MFLLIIFRSGCAIATETAAVQTKNTHDPNWFQIELDLETIRLLVCELELTARHVIRGDTNEIDILRFQSLLSSTKYINKSNEYSFLQPWLNEGLLLSRGKKWSERRKIITPAFHFKILEQYVEVFDRLGNTFVDKVLAKYSPSDDVEVYALTILYALDVMCGKSVSRFEQAESTECESK